MRSTDRPYASAVGHGALGLRDNMRTITELLSESMAQRHLHAEIRGGIVVTNWAADYLGGPWSAAVSSLTVDSAPLDVVGVRFGPDMTEERIGAPTWFTRAESYALCEATTWSYYYDPATVTVSINIGASLSPDARSAIVVAAFHVGNVGTYYPSFGTEKLTDGGLEAWTSATNLTNWTEAAVGAGGGSINQDTSVVLSRNSSTSARVDGSYNASGGFAFTQGSLASVAGAVYRLSGYYRTAANIGADVSARIIVSITGLPSKYMLADGVSTTTADATGIALAPTYGKTRRFIFEFRCPDTGTGLNVAAGAYNAGAGAESGSVWFDGLQLRRVYSYEYALPITTSFPTIEKARENDVAWWAPISTGIGGMTLANDGRWDSIFATFDFVNHDVTIHVGGRFPNGGDEITLDDMATPSVARITQAVVSDTEVNLTLEDGCAVLQRMLPTRTMDSATFPDIAEQDRGKPWPLYFGSPRGIRPFRGGISATYGTGSYIIGEEVDQASDGVRTKVYGGGADTVDALLFSFEDQQAADAGDKARAIALYGATSSGGFATDWQTFTSQPSYFWASRELTPVRIDAKNDIVDFKISSSTSVAALSARIAHGIWRRSGPAAPGGASPIYDPITTRLTNAMSTASGVTISVDYNNVTHKYSITSTTSGTLQLLCNSGTNKATAMWHLLGFGTSSDKTGASTYTAEESVFTSVDAPILRFIRADTTSDLGESCSLMDDSSGTWTGTAGEVISDGGDVSRFLLQRILEVPPANIDATSFATAGPLIIPISAAIGTAKEPFVSAGEVFARIQATCGFDMVQDGGIWYWNLHTTSAPADIVDVTDADLMDDWTAWYDQQDRIGGVRVTFDENVASGDLAAVEVWTTDTIARWGRAAPVKDVRTYCTLHPNFGVGTNASVRAAALAAEMCETAPLRRFRVTIKGKALLLQVGDMIRFTRTRGLDATGAVTSVLARIVHKTDDWAEWTSDVLAKEMLS